MSTETPQPKFEEVPEQDPREKKKLESDPLYLELKKHMNIKPGDLYYRVPRAKDIGKERPYLERVNSYADLKKWREGLNKIQRDALSRYDHPVMGVMPPGLKDILKKQPEVLKKFEELEEKAFRGELEEVDHELIDLMRDHITGENMVKIIENLGEELQEKKIQKEEKSEEAA